MINLIRLTALLLAGAYAGFVAFSIVFDQRDGIHSEYVAWQWCGAFVGAVAGLGAEIVWRFLTKTAAIRFPWPRRFGLRTLLISIALVAVVLGIMRMAR